MDRRRRDLIPASRRGQIVAGLAVVLAFAGVSAVITLLIRGSGSEHRSSQLFSSDSVWNAPLPADTPTDPDSGRLVNALVDEVHQEQRKGTGPYMNTVEASTPLYSVDGGQPNVRVALTNPAPPWRRALQRAFNEVPLPTTAQPAPGQDAHLTLWQPSTDRLWEFFHLRKQGGQWTADWGGAIQNVSGSPGYYSRSSWPGASWVWGASATSLPVIGGTMLIKELQRGVIPHAIALAVPSARAGEWAWPAQRSDGRNTDPTSLPEGARLRLDPKLDVASLGLDPVTAAIARAAQRYGMIIRDQTGTAIGLYGEDPAQYEAIHHENPYKALLPKISTVLLGRFPWDRLQVVQMSLCLTQAAPCAAS